MVDKCSTSDPCGRMDADMQRLSDAAVQLAGEFGSAAFPEPMRDAVSLQRDVALEMQQHVKRAGTCWITVKWRPQIEGRDLDQRGIVAIGPFGNSPGYGLLVAAATDRHSDQLCQRAGKIALIDDRLMHPRGQSRFSGSDRDRLTVDRIPERSAFSR